jgi:hypothetical protein
MKGRICGEDGETMTSHQKEQRERRELSGSNTTTTYHSRAAAELQLEQGQSGRFLEKAAVTGAKAVPQWPRMPEGSPWAGEPAEGIEPSLGYAINDLEVTGTPQEILESLAAQPTDSLTSGGAAAPSALLPLAAEGAPSLLRRARRL